LGKKQEWDKWVRGCSELEFVQIARVGVELGKPMATGTHNSEPLDRLERVL